MAEAPQEQAFRAFMTHQVMLEAYIRAIVRDPVLIDDTLSDVGIEIVRSWSRFDPQRDFAAWSRGLARRVALANLRRWRGTAGQCTLDDDVLEGVGSRIEALVVEEGGERRQHALQQCLTQLTPGQRSLIGLRYGQGLGYEDIATSTQRTANAVYVQFHRLHRLLLTCIRQRLKGQP